jgi:hypothetical protein
MTTLSQQRQDKTGMTAAEFFALPDWKQDEYLTKCEAGWEWADRWAKVSERQWRFMWFMMGLLTATNLLWIGLVVWGMLRAQGAAP